MNNFNISVRILNQFHKLWNMPRLVFILISILSTLSKFETQEDHNFADKVVSVDNFTITSNLVRDFLEHFKNPDANNLPLPIPDPFIMPDRIYPVIGINVATTNVTAYGISRVKIENFTSDLVEMKIHFVLRLENLDLVGNYSYHDWLMKYYSGGFKVIIWNGYTECSAELKITQDGELSAEDLEMDLVSYDKLIITLENAGVVGYFVNTFDTALFNVIKPYFFSLISNNIRSTLNNGLKRIKITFPNSIAPLDLGVAEFRKLLKSNGFDPQHVADYQYASSIYSVDVSRITVTGLSSVYRLGDVRLRMRNNTVNLEVSAETEQLEGSCDWEAGLAGVLTKSGRSSFTVEYAAVTLSVDQSLDIRKKPKVVDLRVSVGNLQLRMDGAGTLDYVAEVAVNLLPNVLRYQILQAAEKPMRRKVQEALDNVDLEKIVLDHLPMMDDQLYHRNATKIEDDFVDEQAMTRVQDLDEEEQL